MFEQIFSIISAVESFYWKHIGCWLFFAVGIYFSIKTKFFQLRVLSHFPSTIRTMISEAKKEQPGLPPLRLFFAAAGGMLGIGNIVAISAAVVIGGPGALFWFWIAILAGSLIKYSEIFLGMKYRKENTKGSYHGAIMFAYPSAFKNRYLAKFLITVAYLSLCIYGVEVYQFTVIVHVFKGVMPGINQEWLIIGMLVFVLYTALGGIRRLANICSFFMPLFISIYLCICLWILFMNLGELPGLFAMVFKSAFVGHAAVGGFVGSTIKMAASQGVARAVYSADIGIGFDSIIHTESKIKNPNQQARIAIMATVLDGIICTMSLTVVLVTGLWKATDITQTSDYIMRAVGLYFPYANILLAIVIFLAGFSVIQSYFVTGMKASLYLNDKWGPKIYVVYAIFSLWFFAHFDQTHVLTVMYLASGVLTLLNLSCIMRLRNEICFKLSNTK